VAGYVAGTVVVMCRSPPPHAPSGASPWSHPQFRLKLEAIGYGFVIPVFFVTSGVTFDLDALLDEPATLALVPVFLTALVIARGVPAIVYRGFVGNRGAVVAGLLQATSLPFIVTASQIGVAIDALEPSTAAAFVAAGLISALVFPATSLTLLRRSPSKVDVDSVNRDETLEPVGAAATSSPDVGESMSARRISRRTMRRRR
jgi:Kef-type K+ transport system membrane component KefB